MRKPLYLILAVLVVVLAATRVRFHRSPAVRAADVTLVAAGPSGVYWVSRAAKSPAVLCTAPRLGGEPRTLAQAGDISSLTPVADGLLYLTQEAAPGSGQLWRVGRRGAPQPLLQGLRSPRGVHCAAGRLYWTETRPSPAPGLACVPLLQPLTLLYHAGADGRGKALLAVSESAGEHFSGSLLGERAGRFYWLQHFGQQYNRATSTVLRVPLSGGGAEQVVRADGLQEAALARQVLYFTAPSEEQAPPLSGRSVRCVPLAGGSPRTLTDWMSNQGRLLLVGERPYYCDLTYVWRIPATLREAQVAAEPAFAPDTVSEYRGALFGRAQGTRDLDSTRLRRQPLSLRARLGL